MELDGITARISQRLYPDSTIIAKGFEETPLPDGFFDAVIGNIPFGNYPVFDPAYGRTPALTRTIHDYFFAKSLDKLRAGGVLALITSRYTMDKQDPAMRRYLAERANLIGAVRLPNTTFKANAGTEVTTDILFLQKRQAGQPPNGESWQNLAPIETADGSVGVNEYFARHPDMMLGQMRLEGGLYGNAEPSLVGEFSAGRLARALSALPAAIYSRREDRHRRHDLPPVEASDLGAVKDGAFAERDGALVIRSAGRFEPADLPASVVGRVRAMLAVREAVRAVFRTQLEDAAEDRIVEARQQLNRTYDACVRRYGPLSARQNVKAFAGDPDQPLLLSLEHYDAHTDRATKTAIFERRTLERYRPVEHVESASEALAISLNEAGGVHWPRMEQLTAHRSRIPTRARRPRVLQSRRWRLGDGRPVLERQCPRQTRHGPGRFCPQPCLSGQHRGSGGGPAGRPATGRNRGADRFILDSSKRYTGLCGTCARHRPRWRARCLCRADRHLDTGDRPPARSGA